MWGVAAIVAFGFALLLWLFQAQIHAGHVLHWVTFALAGFLLLAVHSVAPGWPHRRSA